MNVPECCVWCTSSFAFTCSPEYKMTAKMINKCLGFEKGYALPDKDKEEEVNRKYKLKVDEDDT